MTVEKAFVSKYVGMNGQTLNGKSAALRSIREKAIADFQAVGFPARKSEAWKYTNVTDLLNEKLVSNLSLPSPTLSWEDVKDFAIPGLEGPLVVI